LIIEEYHKLKKTYKKVIVAGESAGGNLALSMSLKIKVDGILLIYPALNLRNYVNKDLSSCWNPGNIKSL
jgi:acetyl esterase/lipase